MWKTLTRWLQTLGLERYAKVFAESEVDLDALRLLDGRDLEQLVSPSGRERRRAVGGDIARRGSAFPRAIPQG